MAKKSTFSKIIFSRTLFITLLLYLQFLVFAGVFSLLLFWAINIFGYPIVTIFNYLFVLIIVNSKMQNEFKISWLILVGLIPFYGSCFYMFLIISASRRQRMKNKVVKEANDNESYQQTNKVIKEVVNNTEFKGNSYYLENVMHYPTYSNTKLTYFKVGEEMFEDIIIELNKAKEYIFMEYFIIEEGYMWNTILAILKEKVKQGVEVRVMYDGLCHITKLPYTYDKKLRSYGIKTKVFAPYRPVLSTSHDNRDHRKITIIDGKIAYNGGINLADEYINKINRYGHWKDTAVKLDGEAINNFILMFLNMWNAKEESKDSYHKYIRLDNNSNYNNGFVVPYGLLPSEAESNGSNIYMDIIKTARNYVHITTPYLVLDQEMMNALKTTARKGVEVVIIVPKINDSFLTDAVAKTFHLELIQAGIKLYEYTPGFIHAKMFVSDDIKAIVGTINLDYRSLNHHYECGTFIYDNEVIQDIENDIQAVIKKSTLVSIKQVKNRGIVNRILGAIGRVIAPLI